MKSKILYGLAFCMMLFCFSSCNDDNDELTDSKLTYYPIFSLQGDAFTLSSLGSKYVDAGCTATLKGEDCTSQIVTTGLNDIDIKTAGLYTVTYTVVNAEGYSKSISRTVAVCDPSVKTDITGAYTTQEGTYRETSKGDVAYPGIKVNITKAAPGIFEVDCILGGYYYPRQASAGTNSNYCMHGYFQLLSDGTIKCLSGDVAAWGDSYSDFSNGKYDAETGTISYVVVYAGTPFHVVLK